MSYNDKKFLDQDGLVTLLKKLDNYPTNEILGTVVSAIQMSLGGKVGDVQINGASIVDGGIANIPYAGTDVFGVTAAGAGLRISGTTGKMIINNASDAQIKVGTDAYQPITPSKQAISTFYGLAAAAGDTTQKSSSNEMGTYTDDAKQAIQNMLGITNLLSTEESSTATAAHALNSTFMMDGKLYKATAAIAIGEAVVEGQNCEAVKADEVFVKNTDYAKQNIPGIVGINSDYGITINNNQPGHYLYINPATPEQIKAGTQAYRPITADRQDKSVFYGLSKIAGVDLKNETVTLGTYPEASKTAIRTMIGAAAVSDIPSVPVQDVQVNGTSILNNNIANIPIGNAGTYGVYRTASSAEIKEAADARRVVAPYKQHEAVFYGLAKAAGDSTQSASSNTIGTYTPEAQSAIKSMIGVGEEAYFINKKDFTNPTTVNSNASSVINAALIAAEAAGKNYCVVPEGEYWLTETIYLQDGVILKGSGMDATTLKIADGCDIDAIRVASPINNSGVMDLSIDGNRITNYNTFNSGHHGNAINVWLHYGRIERVRTNWVYKHSLLLNYDTGNSDDGLGFDSEHQNDVGNLNKVLWCDFRDSLLQGVMWGWRTMDSWMCYTNIGSHAANLYLEGGTSRFIGNHFDGDGDNGAGPEYNVYCGDGCKAMLFDGNIFENTQKQNIFFRQPSYSNQTMTITISNNIIRTCSKSQNEQYPNIYISGYSDSVKATEITITGNQILNPDTNANHGYAGIHLAYCENCKIVGNIFFNVGSDEVIIDGTCDNVLNDSALPKDIQVNGTSIVSNKIATIPIAFNGSDVGLVKVKTSEGIGATNVGQLYINTANIGQIQTGLNVYTPITPSNQHAAAFFGLAKAANADLSESGTIAIGTYPATAKTAIRSMIGATSSNVIAVQDTQPTETDAKIWVMETAPESVEVPTYEEFQALDAEVIKKTDIASETAVGVMKVSQGPYGVAILDNELRTSPSQDEHIQGGTNAYRPLTAMRQHKAVYFGLSKLAGVDLANETVTVGTYPETSKTAIRSLIGAIGTTDYATSTTGGTIRVNTANGVAITNDGQLYINQASANNVKQGTANYFPIVPSHQHEAAFYGLAKAAGDTTMTSSSNAVGTYTAEAKAAIHTMLGIDPASIAAQVDIPLVETVSGTTPTITGQPNVRYVCGEVSTITITPPASGSVDVIFESGSTATVMTVPSTVKWPAWFDAETLETNTTYEILITDGIYGSVMTWAT